MVGREGERPRPREAAFDAGQPGGASNKKEQPKQPEIHYGGTPTLETRLRNGKPVDVGHLYMERRGEEWRWWTERESIEDWSKRVRTAHEQDDPRYRDVAEDRVPRCVTHTSYYDYRSGERTTFYYPDEGGTSRSRTNDTSSMHYSHETPQKRTHKGQYSSKAHKGDSPAIPIEHEGNDLPRPIEAVLGELEALKREKQVELESVDYYLSHMQRRVNESNGNALERHGRADIGDLERQIARVTAEAGNMGTRDIQQKLQDLRWAFHAVSFPLVFQRLGEFRKQAEVHNYNVRQQEWIASHGEARKGVDLIDPKMVRALTWLLEQADIPHEGLEDAPLSIPFTTMEQEMRLFSRAYSMRHETALDHEHKANTKWLMQEWKRKQQRESSG